jgi:proteasome lid subunit RPN8/RPN11
MTLKEPTKIKIEKHALREKPHECCGLLVENKKELKTVECRNVSEKPTQHFSIMPSDYLKACRQGKIKAVYHSHVSSNDKFSINDMMNSRSHKIDYVLYSTKKHSFSFFDHTKNKTSFLNKAFKIGQSDCYTTVKEYYSNLGITLAGNNTLGDDWFNKNPHLIQNLFDLNKNNPDLPIMELSPNSPLREHDVIVFEFVKGEGPNHVAIYLGNGTIIHHPRNKYACIETLNKTLEKTMYKIYRHEKFN